MKAKEIFDLTGDWNYLPPTQGKKVYEKNGLKSLSRKELDGLRYDDLMGLSWTILEGYD